MKKLVVKNLSKATRNRKLNKSNIFDNETIFVNLSDIFDNNRHFVIPNYQRGYAWEKEHVDALWNDICILLENNSQDKHYMGVLALTKTSANEKLQLGIGSDTPCYDIIDGQQRITTLIIMLSELSQYIPEIREKYISNDLFSYKLSYSVNGNNKDFLIENIYNNSNNNPQNLYQSNLNNARNNIREKLECIIDKQKFYDCIINNLEFNLYFSASEFDARKTFETMNYRGKSLTNLELLKNKLIYLSSKNNEKEALLISNITDAWENIYNNLGSNPKASLSDDEFLKAHWLVFGKSTGNMKKKGDSYARDILGNYFTERKYDEETNISTLVDNPPEKILGYVTNLKKCSQIWKYVKFPTLPQNELRLTSDEITILDKLSRIRSFEFINSLILATLYNKNNISYEIRLNLYKILEKFIFINFCFKGRPKSNDLYFCRTAAEAIFNNNNKDANDAELKSLIAKLENDHESLAIKKNIQDVLDFIKDKMNKNFYSNFNKGLNYFLFEYNRHLSQSVNKNAVPLDWNNFRTETIEHILPQKHTKIPSWKLVMDKYKDLKDANNYEIKNIIINNIGNLVGLTTCAKNSSLSNKSYFLKSQIKLSEERDCYKNGTFAEMRIADDYPTWTVKDIHSRALDLINFMFDNWFNDYISHEQLQENKDKYVGFSVLENDQEQLELENTLLNKLYPAEKAEFEKEQEKEKTFKLRISSIVNGDFKTIITNPNISEEIVNKLEDRIYCHETFGIVYNIIKAIDLTKDISEQAKCEWENNNKNKYYVKPINIKGKAYLLCSQWYKKHLTKLLEWIKNNQLNNL